MSAGTVRPGDSSKHRKRIEMGTEGLGKADPTKNLINR